MSQQDKQQFGDGNTDYAEAAKHIANAAREAGRDAAGNAAAAADAGKAAAAAATVQSSVEGGKAVSEVAVGTASGGFVGAVLSAVWALRKPIYKVIICIAIFILIMIVLVISLPSVIFNGTAHATGLSLSESAHDMADIVADCIGKGYDRALAEVERIIETGGFDYDESMEALINNGSASPDYDIAYILAAYSASMDQKDATPEDLRAKLLSVADSMFDVTYTEKSIEQEVEVPNDDTEDPDDVKTVLKTIYYVECTIHPFNADIILTAFGVDLDAEYGGFGITFRQAIDTMATTLKSILQGSLGGGNAPELTDAELLAIVDSLNCSATRKQIIRTALSLVGKVNYFFGGKSAAGWNDDWGEPKVVTASGSPSTGTTRPYGLDCSGYTDWVYKTAGLGTIGAGSSTQWSNSTEISEAQLLPGDLGFKAQPGDAGINHVLIYVGMSDTGERLWVHCNSTENNVSLNSPTYVKYFRRVKDKELESESPPSSGDNFGTPKHTMQVQVTHYCSCTKCCGKNDGITASGKKVAPGMVAMSSHYPFGTKLVINGTMYTVQDRGGKGIENDITRVDIYVPDHQEALRLGRFWTEAAFY